MLNVIRFQSRKCILLSSQPSHVNTKTNNNTSNRRQASRSRQIYQQSYTKLISHRFLTRSSNMDSSNVFTGKSDRFNGVIVDSTRENLPSQENFETVLKNTMNLWIEKNKRGTWFKVNIAQSSWIPILVQHGFKFHHAQENYVMLFRWLPTDESSNVPPYAHTMVGVGAVVVNDEDEVLVVAEKYIDRPHWKLPGGYVEPGENFVDAAIREVYEETNIHTEFRSVLAFRHGHGGQYGCSDLYTVVSLKPLSTDMKKCEREIVDCRWMGITEYLNHPDIHDLNRLFAQKYLDNKDADIIIDCRHGIHQVLKKPYTVYHAIPVGENVGDGTSGGSNGM